MKFVEILGIVITIIFLGYQNHLVRMQSDQTIKQTAQMIDQTNEMVKQNAIETRPIIVADSEKQHTMTNIGIGAAFNLVSYNVVNSSTIIMFNGVITALGAGRSILDTGLDNTKLHISNSDFNFIFDNKIDLNAYVDKYPVVVQKYEDINGYCFASIYAVGSYNFREIGKCKEFNLICTNPKN